MKATLKDLSNDTHTHTKHQLSLFEDRNDVYLRQLWNANAANAGEYEPSLASWAVGTSTEA